MLKQPRTWFLCSLIYESRCPRFVTVFRILMIIIQNFPIFIHASIFFPNWVFSILKWEKTLKRATHTDKHQESLCFFYFYIHISNVSYNHRNRHAYNLCNYCTMDYFFLFFFFLNFYSYFYSTFLFSIIYTEKISEIRKKLSGIMFSFLITFNTIWRTDLNIDQYH
jgi:hypothetical protein